MKEIKNTGAQGDVFFVRVDSIPRAAKAIEATSGRHVIARGGSGEHYVMSGSAEYMTGEDDRTAYLRVGSDGAQVLHGREANQHETILLSPGDWMVRRQREHAPDGFRRVED